MVRQQKNKVGYQLIPRDISWLSFNARVLQEAADQSVPLRERIKFLGIFSNNLDEFFRVRVAALKRMMKYGAKKVMHIEDSPQTILDQIQRIVLQQQNEFNRIWDEILQALNKRHIFLLNEKELNKQQQAFVIDFFEKEIRSSVIPLMIESIPSFPYLREKSIYLAIVMSRKKSAYDRKYALIEVPTRSVSRFVELPSPTRKEKYIILLEDVIRFCLPTIFSYFGFDHYQANVVKVTKDAEFDLDYEDAGSYSEKILKGIRDRRKGKPVRFIYDKEIDPALLDYLTRRMGLSKKDLIIPGGRIHNFKHFMDFPSHVVPTNEEHRSAFIHPQLRDVKRVTDVVLKKDILLHFPYHSFDPVIDLLREAAIDPEVSSIKITAYRLAEQSKVINTLINAVRNGKDVTVMLELRARFDEERNLEWKQILEEEGVKVVLGMPNEKVHAKICVVRKRTNNRIVHYGFVSTGNLNEKTARFYGDTCLLTANKQLMADINRVFMYLEKPKSGQKYLKLCKTLVIAPTGMRECLSEMIHSEIKNARNGLPASIGLKLNSLSDPLLIGLLYDAAEAGVTVQLVIRGIFCCMQQNNQKSPALSAVSIIDEYLEHARWMIFHNNGDPAVLLSSADWMVRNLDHRVEVACPILSSSLKQEIIDLFNIQLKDNIKARKLNARLENEYVRMPGKKLRSQIEMYHYLYNRSLKLKD